MKTLLSLIFCACILPVAQSAEPRAAVVWEYATLSDMDGSMRSFVSWNSPSGTYLEAYDAKALAVELKQRGELKESATVVNMNQLLQALGREGWELVQVQNGDRPERQTKSQTYYFKRQKS